MIAIATMAMIERAAYLGQKDPESRALPHHFKYYYKEKLTDPPLPSYLKSSRGTPNRRALHLPTKSRAPPSATGLPRSLATASGARSARLAPPRSRSQHRQSLPQQPHTSRSSRTVARVEVMRPHLFTARPNVESDSVFVRQNAVSAATVGAGTFVFEVCTQALCRFVDNTLL